MVDKTRVRRGHYLGVASGRYTPERWAPDEGFARVERVERINEPSALIDARDPTAPLVIMMRMAIAFCRGVPGPVLLGEDQTVLRAVSEARLAHDLANPTWRLAVEPVFVGAVVIDTDAGRPEPVSAAGPALPGPARRAAAFGKPASSLRVGEYLRLLDERFPAEAMGVDEGYARVEWLGCVPPERVPAWLRDPALFPGGLLVASVFGLSGALLLAGDTRVEVLIEPNVERVACDQAEPWQRRPWFPLAGLRPLTPPRDAPAPPRAPQDEAALYPTKCRTAHERELLLRGVTGLRMVPLSSLPWPMLPHKCVHKRRFADAIAAYPDGPWRRQSAVAEVFGALTAQDFAACEYHQADWAMIGAVAAEIVAGGVPDRFAAAQIAEADPRLSEDDGRWAASLFASPIEWGDGDELVAGGQHRMCGLRAAGVATCPVSGRYLPHRPYPPARPAGHHARTSVARFWSSWLPGPRILTGLGGRALARWPTLRTWASRLLS